MFSFTDKQKEWVKAVGVWFIVLGNLLFTLIGFKQQPTSIPQTKTLLTKECSSWLMEHDDFTAPPVNCREELKLLKKRVDKEVNVK